MFFSGLLNFFSVLRLNLSKYVQMTSFSQDYNVPNKTRRPILKNALQSFTIKFIGAQYNKSREMDGQTRRLVQNSLLAN